mmetsp:Transcript_20209/g.34520  ORF Transcript_20209/g.34520 Transcript_20209/m.34520 type:complete len:138 (-) Transcript_20209:43-456(-)
MTDYGDDPNQVNRWSMKGLALTHCFRPTVLTSLSIGAVVGLAKGYMTKQIFTGSRFFVFGFCGAASILWPICRFQQSKKKEQIETLMDAQLHEVNKDIKKKIEAHRAEKAAKGKSNEKIKDQDFESSLEELAKKNKR